MDYTELNIQDLPICNLEKIFSYVPHKNPLRLVSKYFRSIINGSRKLMFNTRLNVQAKAKDKSGTDIDAYIQRMFIPQFGPEELDVVKNYKWRKHIKFLRYNIHKEGMLKSFILLRSVSFKFKNLVEITITFPSKSFMVQGVDPISLDADDENKLNEMGRLKLQSLKTLQIVDMHSNNRDILHFFTKSPKLKKLVLHNIENFTTLNRGPWKLEELKMNPRDFNPYAVRFFEKQSSSLKVLTISGSAKMLNDIVRLLPHLEILRLNVRDYLSAIGRYDTVIKFYKNIEDMLEWKEV
ncbi:uncharacterized protein [Chironomus tepperi]|uniref:uncharacterized protein isoform X2 n=1 Tax=Chironomus tepperi TaxID=113505 RepID=UPI00391EEF7C